MKISKREANRLERRAAIVQIARKHFFENGFSGTSMSAIASELGGSKGTLWSYFSSKEELFGAVVDETSSQVRAELDLGDPDADPLKQLILLCRSFIDRGTSPMVQSMMRLVISESHRQPEIGRIFFDRGPRLTQKLVESWLHDKLADKLWTTDYLGAGKTLVALCMEGSFYEQLWGVGTQPSARQRNADAHKAALLFLRAYGTPEVVQALESGFEKPEKEAA